MLIKPTTTTEWGKNGKQKCQKRKEKEKKKFKRNYRTSQNRRIIKCFS